MQLQITINPFPAPPSRLFPGGCASKPKLITVIRSKPGAFRTIWGVDEAGLLYSSRCSHTAIMAFPTFVSQLNSNDIRALLALKAINRKDISKAKQISKLEQEASKRERLIEDILSSANMLKVSPNNTRKILFLLK